MAERRVYEDGESVWTPIGGVEYRMEMWRLDGGGWELLLYRGDDDEPVFWLEGRDDEAQG